MKLDFFLISGNWKIYDLIDANSINSFCVQTRTSLAVIGKKLMSSNFSFLILFVVEKKIYNYYI